MKLKLYLVSIILLVSQLVFLQQYLGKPVFKSFADYGGAGATINHVYHCCYLTATSPYTGKPVPAFGITFSKTPAANISTFKSDNQSGNIARILNTGLNSVMGLSNPANCNFRLSFKNSDK